MIDRPLKEKIGKLYAAATKLSIALAAASIVLSGIAMYSESRSRLDYYLSYAAVLMLIATPFAGILMAVFHYSSEKNRKMLTFSTAILAILIIGILTKI